MIYTGKDLNEVLALAANDQNVAVDDLQYEVIENVKGFLGIGSKVTIDVFSYADVTKTIEDYLNTYFESALNMEVEVEVINHNGEYKVNLNSENNAILIGRNGYTLQCLNTLTKTVVKTKFKKFIPILIDVEGYKDEKYRRVCRLAVRVAKDVQRTRINAALDPMTNDERKAVHQYLTNMPNIRTISEGEGNRRHLTIVFDETKK